jgi:hypothetical protein
MHTSVGVEITKVLKLLKYILPLPEGADQHHQQTLQVHTQNYDRAHEIPE